ncbi:MAG: hypothetical protein WA775_05615 [Psychroserpens sp.]|uniref:tetratricopeptide repeat protein n=1 Tax=Psychroserpens sp. TaxID=2020870 RepID=UPI003CA59923
MKHKELIALYFDGTLDKEQTALFDDLILHNAEFKAQVEIEQNTKKAIISIKKDDLKNRLQQLEQPKNKTKFYRIAIAASLIITLGIFGLSQLNTPVSNDQLFAEHFEPYTNIIIPASRGDEIKDAKSEAFAYYDAKNYSLACQKFETLYNATTTPYYLFYQAICQLQLGKTENAIALFEMRKSISDKLSSHNTWYLALAYLKADKIENSKVLLQKISSDKSYNYKAAEDILNQLD